MHKAMAWPKAACNNRKIGCQIAQIAHHAIGQRARHAKALVNRRVHLAPIGTNAMGVVEILNHRDRRFRRVGHRLVIGHAAGANGRGIFGWGGKGRDLCGHSITDHHALRVGSQHGPTGEGVKAALALRDLNRVANSGGVNALQQG